VLDDFGKLDRTYRETDENGTGFDSIISDLLSSQFKILRPTQS
jgi:hypothetical protein